MSNAIGVGGQYDSGILEREVSNTALVNLNTGLGFVEASDTI